MDGITIHISWEYFLGIIGTFIGVAWYSNGRFTALETSMKWVKEILNELKISSDNSQKPAFIIRSPVNLNETGEKWLIDSGLKNYIDNNVDFMKSCEEKRNTNPYEVQKFIFRLFDDWIFESGLEDELKKFAYSKGTTMGVIRRVGAIYFRNFCLKQFGMNKEDIDKHNPVIGGEVT